MEASGFGLAIIAETRTLVSSIKARIANIRDGPDTFRILTDELERLMRHLTDVETHLQSAPAAIPASISTVFNETLASVRAILIHSNSTLEKDCTRAFRGSSGGVTARVKSLFRRTIQATALSSTMNALRPQVQGASVQLLTLISMLVTGLKSQEQEDVLVPILDSLRVAGSVAEVFRVGAGTPALPQGTTLNFTAKDTDGRHSTPEGILKESILSTEFSSTVTAAAGVITPAHGVVGMAGVGKTIALQGLAFDDDIRARFPDGVQYIALGQGATVSMAIGAIAKIMRLTGASASVAAVERSTLLQDAVDYAVSWFERRICLFLVDDLWPTEDCPTGFLNNLRQLLRCCPESRMAITTRSTVIADSAGRTVDFAPRAPLGTVSVSIFMMHATQDATEKAPQESTGALKTSVAAILTICAGLPIALAVAGCTVAFLAKEQGDFERACDTYASKLAKQRIELGEEQGPGGTSLNAGIILSLKILEAELVKLKSKNTVDSELTISDLYISLCVLRHQVWVPVSVLSRMWKVGKDFALAVVRLFSGLSLCKLTFREHGQGVAKEGGLTLHDLHLDFCKQQAETTTTSSLWHARLLNGYLGTESRSGCSMRPEQGGSFEQMLFECRPRSWWSIPNDGYIPVNLSRHLLSANMVMELAALLLDARWTYVRAEIGGMLALKSDFECLLTLEGEILAQRVSQSFELICKAIQLSWGRVSEGQRAFLFQVCGRLCNLRTDNEIVAKYLRSVETHTPAPYLLPVNPFFPHPHSAQLMEIPVGSDCQSLACSCCGKYIAAGAGSIVVVADAWTGDILKRLEGHTDDIECLSFAVGSKKIVSGSHDRSVVVWEWETSELPVQVFRGHSRSVLDVAFSSKGGKVFSCSCDRTLKIWDTNTGAQIGEFVQQYSVVRVVVSSDDQTAAIGLGNGTVKVLDYCAGDTIFQNADEREDDILCVAFRAKDQQLATVSRNERIRIWDTRTWSSSGATFEGHTFSVKCGAIGPDGHQIASGSWDDTVRLWDANTGRHIWTSPNMHSEVRSVTFTPDGKRIISGSIDGILRIWDTGVDAEANDQEYGPSDPFIYAVANSHNGNIVASGSKDGTLRLWNSRTGSQIGHTLEGHTYSVRCVSFSSDGRWVATGSRDSTVRLWDSKTLLQIGNPLEGHIDCVNCVSFSWDGFRLVSGSRDKTVCIWNTKSGMQIGDALQGHVESVVAISESSDGCHIVSRDFEDVVIIWNRMKRSIAWQSQPRLAKSSDRDTHASYEMTGVEAEKIIRSCGQETPHLWPSSFPAYTAEVYCRNNSVYANMPTGSTLLGTLPSEVNSWKYNEVRKVFVAGLQSGAVAVSNLTVRCE